ncbi:hypothetical protein Smp_039590 [Schistosoma mansoni]|uniref:hypothetical protein n=1 Tax=Schistosoma mansoni TaxID=6183 RepID=UPI00022DCBE6|nr:hypothetical protein Smp_039590 [Schistosoma mansoni]|eukprot:XP_018655506.1 hypothetical protein Smp_039590 [Schistosoma mansoni]
MYKVKKSKSKYEKKQIKFIIHLSICPIFLSFFFLFSFIKSIISHSQSIYFLNSSNSIVPLLSRSQYLNAFSTSLLPSCELYLSIYFLNSFLSIFPL